MLVWCVMVGVRVGVRVKARGYADGRGTRGVDVRGRA
jgi:hypothetical protein